MQDLEKKWEAGKTYLFEHPRGLWFSPIKILGYEIVEEPDGDWWFAVKVRILKDTRSWPRGQEVLLNAKADWKYKMFNHKLENK